MTRLISAAVLFVVLAAPAWAGFDEGLAAHKRGDYATALREWRPLAEQGDAAAQFNLGVMYSKGRGVPQDYAEAVKWYKKAAEQNDDFAQGELGFMYGKGRGVPQDYVQAHMWLNLGATQGNKLALKNRVIIAKKMTPADISKAQQLAREWWAKHGKKH